MNFPVSSVVLIILLLPGVILLKAYYGHLIKKESNIHVPFAELLLRGIIFSIFIHCIALCIMHWWLKKTPLFDVLFEITFSSKASYSNEQYLIYFRQFCFYHLCVFAVTWVLTKVFKRIAEASNWTTNIASLRNAHYWYTMFSAKYLDSTGIAGTQKKTSLIYLDILTKDKWIYTGYLRDFNYNPVKDELENIVLQATFKRKFEKDAEKAQDPNEHVAGQRTPSTGDPVAIPGEYFIIKFSEVVNINVYYLVLELLDKKTKKVVNPFND